MKIEITWKRVFLSAAAVVVGAPVLFVAALFINARLNPPEVYPADQEDPFPEECRLFEEGVWLPVDDRAKFLGVMEFVQRSGDADASVTWETAGEFALDWHWHHGTDARVYYKVNRTERSLLPLEGAFIHFVGRPRYFIDEVTDDPCAVAVVICGREDWIDRHVYARGDRNLRQEGILCDHVIYTESPP